MFLEIPCRQSTSMMNCATSFVCSCFLKRNIFVPEYDIHVNFVDENQFKKQFKLILNQKGCKTEEKYREVITNIQKEIERRKNLGHNSKRRKEVVEFLDKQFVQLIDNIIQNRPSKSDIIACLNSTYADQVFSYPVFTEDFCKLFIEELENFEASDCPKGRPNSMNNYGVLLEELGFDDFINTFMLDYLQPLAAILYPEWTGKGLDSAKAFIVQYKMNQDLSLSYHYDNAEVTLNVALGQDFEGGELYFGNMCHLPLEDTECALYEHQLYHGVLHRGQHMHGALPITRGNRYNLIVWMRASSVRNQQCPMCGCKPDLIPTEGIGDGFTAPTVDACSCL